MYIQPSLTPMNKYENTKNNEIVYFKNMNKNKWQKNDNNRNKVNMIMLIMRLQNSNNYDRWYATTQYIKI